MTRKAMTYHDVTSNMSKGNNHKCSAVVSLDRTALKYLFLMKYKAPTPTLSCHLSQCHTLDSPPSQLIIREVGSTARYHR